MRYKIILLIVLFVGCKPEVQLCLDNLEFVRHKNGLIPPTVTLVFRDERGLIEKAMKNKSFETLFIHSFDKDERLQGYMTPGRYKRTGDLTELYIGINYFEDPSRRRWSKKEVEYFLTKGDIGLIVERDTIIVKKCNK